jgi:heme exporter protein A
LSEVRDSSPHLEVIKLTKAFGEHYALIEVSAQWHKREVCALLGPNGAGKSTLLNLLSTLTAASEGSILLDGVKLSRKTAVSLRRQIGFVGHQTMIYGSLNALENLRFFAQLYDCWPSELGQDRSDQDAWLIERLAAVGLKEAAYRLANGFSRGMSQRLTLARALLPTPSLLLLDEPFTGLDRSGIQQISQLLIKARDAGATIIVSSHDLDTTAAISDRALILNRGRLRTLVSLDQGSPSLMALYQGSVG